jgi:glucose dehydrogenase
MLLWQRNLFVSICAFPHAFPPQAKTPPPAPPATYELNGRQYVVTASTGNKPGKQNEYGDAYAAFALPE